MKPTLVLCAFYLWLCSGIVSGELVASYRMETLPFVVSDSSTCSGIFGPREAAQAYFVDPAPGISGQGANFNGGLGNRIEAGFWNIGSPNGTFSLTAWINPSSAADSFSRVISKGDSRFSADIDWALTFDRGDDLRLVVNTGSGGVEVISSDTRPPNGVWTHVAATYDGEYAVHYVNGSEVYRQFEPGALVERLDNLVVLGNQYSEYSSDYHGLMDEVYVFDSALSPEDIFSLYDNVVFPFGVPPVPSVVNAGNTSFQANALDPFAIDVVVEDPDTAPAELTYEWSVTESTSLDGCGGVEFSDPMSPSTTIDFQGVIGLYTIRICVKDDLTAVSTTVEVDVGGLIPIIESQPENLLELERGKSHTIGPIVARAFPDPTYQWQELISMVVTGNGSTFERYFDPLSEETDKFGCIAEGVNTEWGGVTCNSAWWGKQPTAANMYAAIRSSIDRESGEPHQFGRQSTVMVWQNLPNGTNPSYVTPELTDNYDGKMLRCIVVNFEGIATSNNITISVIEPLGSGDGGSDNGLAAGLGVSLPLLALLLLVCCCCCCCLAVLVALIVILLAVAMFAAKRTVNADHIKKITPPEFDAFSYGLLATTEFLEYTEKTDVLDELESILIEAGPQIAPQLLDLCSNGARPSAHDKNVISMVCVYHLGGALGMSLVNQLIVDEVDNAKSEGTLFRSNSYAAKAFTGFAKIVGIRYLWALLVQMLHSIRDKVEDLIISLGLASLPSLSVDIGASESATGTEVDEGDALINVMEVLLSAQKLLKIILASRKQFPLELCGVVRALKEKVESADHFSDIAVYRAIGGFLFLRFYCPILLSPQSWGIFDSLPSPVFQRFMVVVTKVLQNLANNTLPSAKEETMAPFDTFVTDNVGRVERFYEELADRACSWQDAASAEQAALRDAPRVRANSLSYLVQCLRHEDNRERWPETKNVLEDTFDIPVDVLDRLEAVIMSEGPTVKLRQ